MEDEKDTARLLKTFWLEAVKAADYEDVYVVNLLRVFPQDYGLFKVILTWGALGLSDLSPPYPSSSAKDVSPQQRAMGRFQTITFFVGLMGFLFIQLWLLIQLQETIGLGDALMGILFVIGLILSSIVWWIVLFELTHVSLRKELYLKNIKAAEKTAAEVHVDVLKKLPLTLRNLLFARQKRPTTKQLEKTIEKANRTLSSAEAIWKHPLHFLNVHKATIASKSVDDYL
ncbi:MAG: hypothetical protein AAF485_24680, partial [Chloroflexota bacterium]